MEKNTGHVFKKKTYDVCVIAPWDSIHIINRYNYVKKTGYSSVKLVPGEGMTNNSLISKCNSLKKFVFTLYKIKAKVYHVHYVKSFAAILTYLFGKYPLIITTMGGDILLNEQGDSDIFQKLIVKTILKNSNIVTVKSLYNYDSLKREFGITRQVERLTWGVDSDVFYRIKKKVLFEGLPSEKKIILQPRGLNNIYNNEILFISIRNLVFEGVNDFVLWLPKSKNSYNFNKYKNLVKELGIEDYVIFSKNIDSHDMNIAYNKASIVVSIAESDGLPMTILEALSVGVPVIVGKIPHLQRELSDDVVEWCNITPESLSKKIKFLLNKHDILEDKKKRISFVYNNFNLKDDLNTYKIIIDKLTNLPIKHQYLSRSMVIVYSILHIFNRLLTQLLGRKIMNWTYLRDLPKETID